MVASVADLFESLSRVRVLWRWVTSDRLLGVVSGTILAWTTLPTLSSVPVLGALAPGVTALHAALPAALVTLGLSVLLLAVVAYAYLPRIYVDPLSEPIDDVRHVRLALSFYAFGVASLLYLWGLSFTFGGLPTGLARPSQATLVGWVVAGFPLVGVLLLRAESRSLADPRNYFTRALVFISGDDDTRETIASELESLRGNVWLFRTSLAFAVVGSTALYLMPALFFGMFVGVLSLYYPVLEVVALLGVAGKWLLRSDRTPDPTSTLGDGFEAATAVDTAFYRQVRTSVGVRSWGIFVPLVFGILTAVLPLLLRRAFQTPGDGFTPETLVEAYAAVPGLRTVPALVYAVDRTGDALVLFALSVTPLLVVCYGLWYWYHVVRRVPSLLYHSGIENRDERLPDSARTPLVSKPTGYFLPLGVVVEAWLSQRFTWGQAFVPVRVARSEFGFLLVWSLGVALVAWSIVRTRRATPTPATGPFRELYAPLGVQILLVFDMGLDRAVPAGQLLAILGLSTVYLFYGRTIFEYLDDLSRPRRVFVSAVAASIVFVLGTTGVSATVSALAASAVFAVYVVGGEIRDTVEE